MQGSQRTELAERIPPFPVLNEWQVYDYTKPLTMEFEVANTAISGSTYIKRICAISALDTRNAFNSIRWDNIISCSPFKNLTCRFTFVD